MTISLRRFVAATAGLAITALVSGCASKGELVVDDGVGITAVRTTCPAVGIPNYTGDVTLFRDGEARDVSAIDLAANMTDVRGNCDQAGKKAEEYNKRHPNAAGQVRTNVTFQVEARRADTAGARDVTLPWFITVLRGGTAVVSKRVGTVTLHFNDGQARTQATASGLAVIDKAEATLDKATRDKNTHRRNAGQADAALDPLADPDVKEAVKRATFEVLVGFQLDDKQLAYNATR